MLGEQLLMSLKVMLLGFGTVFITLVLLIYVIQLINKVINIDSKPKESKDIQGNNAVDKLGKAENDLLVKDSAETIVDVDDEEIIAIITAAIAASLNRSTHDIVVRSVKRIPNRTPAWNQASRGQQIATRL